MHDSAALADRLEFVHHFASLAKRWLLAICGVLALAPPAGAVVISTFDGTGNTTAPGTNPFWGNVARMSSASAVYLGNRWAITANHVTSAPVRFSDGTTLPVVPGSEVVLKVPGSTSVNADLRMFRVPTDPGLPAVTIPTASPTAGTTVMMIGAGLDREPNEIAWSLTQLGTWNPAPIPLANFAGFNLKSSAEMRWGMNQIDSASLTTSNNTITFSTRFDAFGQPFEAQAAVGDSGGGVFRFLDGAWQLAGLMESVTPLASQPSGTVVFGNFTLSANLPSYRDQIVALTDRPDPAWQNQFNYFDVNRSGTVTAVDALLILNTLAKTGNHDLTGAPGPNDKLVDASGDNFLSATDALRVINFLSTHPVSASVAGTNFVPEPGGMVLAALGLLALVAIVRRRALTTWRAHG